MPNLLITSNSRFSPFSYQEMLAPVLMATQAQQEIENAYSDLDTQANAIGSLANEADDPETYAKYKSYEAALRNQADLLASQGLTPGSRKALLDLKGRYASDITPIQNAVTRRRALADEQRKALLANPTLMFQRDFNKRSKDTSLDRFLENPDYDYGEQYSGALITKQVSDMASHLAKELRGIGSGRLDEYTKTFMKKYGLSSDEVLSAITNPNDPRGSRALNAIYDSVLQSVPESIRNQYARDVNAYATQGFWSAIGQNQISPYEDYGARLQGQLALSRAKKGLDNTGGTSALFPKSTTQMPVSPATAKSSSVKDIVNRYIRVDDSGKLHTKNFRVTGDMYGYGTGMTKSNSVDTNLFVASQGQRIKTRSEFVSAGRTKEEKEDLGRYYDYNVQPVLDDMNNGSSKGITARDFKKYADSYGDKVLNENSTFIDVIDFPLGGTPENIEKGMSNLLNQTVWEIGPSKDKASWQKTKEAGTLQDIINEVKKNKGSFSTGFAVQKNNRGYVLTTKDKAYFIPLSQINSSTSKGLEQLLNLWSNSTDETDASNYQEVFISGLGILANGTYNTNKFDITNQPTVK